MIDLFTINYGEGFVRWGQPFRLYHMSSGKFLAIGEREDVTLVDSHEADKKQTAFAFMKKSVSYKIHWLFLKSESYLNRMITGFCG